MLAFLFALALHTSPASRADSARLEGNRLVIGPIGLSLELPAIWLGQPAPPGRDMVCGNSPSGPVADRVITEPARLLGLQNPQREWITEFAAVIDSVLPFRSLAAQAGAAPWLGDCVALWLRVYVGNNLRPDLARINTGTRVAARYFKPVTQTQVDSAGWQITRISWPAWYYDYGGPANVEFWARTVRGRDVVIVFMFAPGSDEQLRDRGKIIASVRE